jgi:hypothetical protein
MLTRLYIDNFKCFVKFEYRPARTQLILGANGSGKSSLIDALTLLHRFAVQAENVAGLPLLDQRTRWLHQREQIFELEATLDGGSYVYRAVIESPRIAEEAVHFDGRPIFKFSNGQVYLYDDSFEQKYNYPIDWNRSALATVATVAQAGEMRRLTRFRHWLGGLGCFRMNPFAMAPVAETAQENPNFDLSNIASWYRHLEQFSEPNELITSLRETLAGLQVFSFCRPEAPECSWRNSPMRMGRCSHSILVSCPKDSDA